MNTANPFQIPECFQKADLQQRRRERFKRGVIAIVFAIMALLVVLLIQGCVSERTQAATPVDRPQLATESSHHLAVSQPMNQTTSLASAKPPALSAPQKSTQTVYVVKSGDSLTRIAKLHGTTIKAIKAANDLASDRIVVGARLKIPQV